MKFSLILLFLWIFNINATSFLQVEEKSSNAFYQTNHIGKISSATIENDGILIKSKSEKMSCFISKNLAQRNNFTLSSILVLISNSKEDSILNIKCEINPWDLPDDKGYFSSSNPLHVVRSKDQHELVDFKISLELN